MKQNNSGSRAKNAGISIVVIAAMLISGFAAIATPAAIAEDYIGGPYGGGLRVALPSEPSSLNPLAASLNESAAQVIDLLYESLGRVDPYTLEIEPWLASSWVIDPDDDRIVSLTLRDGILWHDGTELTVEDVEYTFGTNGYGISYLSSMTTDAANNTITFNLAEPDARFFSEMLLMKIVPDGFTAASAPMGCGPFKLVSSDGDATELEAFDDHFMARPYIDTVTYSYYPKTTAWSADDYPYTQIFSGDDPRNDGLYRAAYDVITDKIDFIGWDLKTEQITMMVEVSGNNTNLLQNPNSTTVKSSGLKQWYLGFNNQENHTLNDVALRQAIAYALEKDKLTVYDISGGLEAVDSVISKYNLPWFNSSIDYPAYDITKARQILKDANYDDYDGDGFIDKPGPDPAKPYENFEPFNLTLFGPRIEEVTAYTMSTNIITWFDILGLNVTLVNNTMDVHMANILADNFDMYLADENTATLDPQFIDGLFNSENIANNKNLLNFAGKCMKENYSLMSQIVDHTTWTAQLPDSKLVGDVFVYHNGTLITDYTISMDDGLFTLDDDYVLDYAQDTLTITYTYLAFDSVISKANAQMDPAMRAKYIKEAQAVITDMMPSIPLFSYMISHAYRTNIYVDWVQTLGGINNYWSFTSIKNKVEGSSAVMLSSVKNFLNDGETMNLFVKVQDSLGAPIEADFISMAGEGTFGTPVYDGAGQQYTVQYTAPSTTNSRTITVSVEAYTVGYLSGSDTLDITVHPLQKNFNVDISRGATSLASGNTTSISVIVKDKATNTVVSGANVVLTMTPAGLGGYLEEVSGTTNAAGEFVTNFGSDNVTIDTTFRITAYVTKAGYVDAEQTTSIGVARDPDITIDSDKGLLGLPAPSFMAIIVLLSGMSVAFAISRRKRK